MAFHYFKIPPHLAVSRGIANKKEKRLPDGNYFAICQDFGMAHYKMLDKAASMGCLALTPEELIQELRGEACRLLPQPTDPKYFPDENFDPLTGSYINGKDEESVSATEEAANTEAEGTDSQDVEIVTDNSTDEEREPDMVFEDEDGEPFINVYFPHSEVEESEEEEDEPNEEGGE